MKKLSPPFSGSTYRHSAQASRRVGLWLLFLAAAAVRLTVVLTARSYLLPNVWYEYGEIAANLLNGNGFSVEFLGRFGPTASQAPVYPFLVATAYKLFGVHNAAAILWIQVSQAILGACLPIVIASICWHALPEYRVIGWASGAFAAIHPTLVYAVTHVQPITLLAVEAALLLLCGFRIAGLDASVSRRGLIVRAIVLGSLGGLTLLTDPIHALVILSALVTAVLWRPARSVTRLPLSRRLWAAGVALIVSALCVAPWCLRNYLVFDRFVPIKSTFGYAFWQGNHPRSWGTDKVPRAEADDLVATFTGGLRDLATTIWKARHETRYIDDMVLTREDRARLAQMAEPDRCRWLLARAMAYIRTNPSHYVKLTLQRLRYFLLFDETNPRTRLLPYRAYHAVFVVLTLLGLWHGRSLGRRLWPLVLAYGAVCLFHSLTIVSIRFRIPVEAFQGVYASVGLLALLGFRWPAPLEEHTEVADEQASNRTRPRRAA